MSGLDFEAPTKVIMITFLSHKLPSPSTLLNKTVWPQLEPSQAFG